MPGLPRALSRALLHGCRVFSLLLLSSLGTVILMRSAPGYFSDVREMDAEHAGAVREALSTERGVSTLQAWTGFLKHAAHLDFGNSRQYATPVWPLLRPRLWTSLKLLLPSVLLGPLTALLLATFLLLARGRLAETGLASAATVLCAVPISVLTLFCLLSGQGGPASILFALVAARDFRFFSRLLRTHSIAPHLFHARASGVRTLRLLSVHLLWPMRRQVLALVLTSFLIGLNAVPPVEVIFGVPGVGQLAWGAAMNRDMPVLLAITMVMALSVACVGVLNSASSQTAQRWANA